MKELSLNWVKPFKELLANAEKPAPSKESERVKELLLGRVKNAA